MATRQRFHAEHRSGIPRAPNASRTPDLSITSEENIFLFIPNLIGYARIVLAITSLYYMPFHPRTCCFLYSVSCLLDALDGFAARRFQQSTQFGAVLDMVTDRCTTACLLVFLASAFPRWSIIFQGLISLDLASHYVHMYATLAMGSHLQSHKKINGNRPWVMRVYYTNNLVLFTVCLLNEMFFISLYLLSFSTPRMMQVLVEKDGEVLSLPGDAALNPQSIWTTPWSAGAMEMARANKMDSRVPWIALCGSCVFMLIKQYVNVIQLIEASKWLAEGDLKRRKALGLPRKKLYPRNSLT